MNSLKLVKSRDDIHKKCKGDKAKRVKEGYDDAEFWLKEAKSQEAGEGRRKQKVEGKREKEEGRGGYVC